VVSCYLGTLLLRIPIAYIIYYNRYNLFWLWILHVGYRKNDNNIREGQDNRIREVQVAQKGIIISRNV
jgi:hypothetical protein